LFLSACDRGLGIGPGSGDLRLRFLPKALDLGRGALRERIGLLAVTLGHVGTVVGQPRGTLGCSGTPLCLRDLGERVAVCILDLGAR